MFVQLLLPARCAGVVAAAITLITFAYTLHVTLSLTNGHAKYASSVRIGRSLRSLALANVLGPVSWVLAWLAATSTRGGSVLESRHVFAFWAITLFNATTYFLIRAVCHQIALEAEDVEAQVSLKQVQGKAEFPEPIKCVKPLSPPPSPLPKPNSYPSVKRLLDRIKENPNVPRKATLKVASAIFSRRRRSPQSLAPSHPAGQRDGIVSSHQAAFPGNEAGMGCHRPWSYASNADAASFDANAVSASASSGPLPMWSTTYTNGGSSLSSSEASTCCDSLHCFCESPRCCCNGVDREGMAHSRLSVEGRGPSMGLECWDTPQGSAAWQHGEVYCRQGSCSTGRGGSFGGDADLRRVLRESVAWQGDSQGGQGREGVSDDGQWAPSSCLSPAIQTLHLYMRTCDTAQCVAALRASCHMEEDVHLDHMGPCGPYEGSCSLEDRWNRDPCVTRTLSASPQRSCCAHHHHVEPCGCSKWVTSPLLHCQADEKVSVLFSNRSTSAPAVCVHSVHRGAWPQEATSMGRQGSGHVDGILEELLGTTVLEVLVEPEKAALHTRSHSF